MIHSTLRVAAKGGKGAPEKASPETAPRKVLRDELREVE
jgi:hypothetical protein